MPTPVPADSQKTSDAVRAGPFHVRTEPADIDSFARALNLTAANGSQLGTVPLTFPIRWLGLPSIREAISESIGNVRIILVQESQSFHYASPLKVGCDYTLTIEIHREIAPPHQVVVHVMADDIVGCRVVHFDTVLRVFSADGRSEKTI